VVVPWGQRTPLATERALAAVGDRPVVHAVLKSTQRDATSLDLASNTERAEFRRVECWYDDERSLLRGRVTIGGRLFADVLTRQAGAAAPGAGREPSRSSQAELEPAVTGFASRYRAALESGQARIVDADSSGGRDGIVLRIDVGPSSALQYDEVVLDERYRPLRFRYRSGSKTSPWWRVVAIETVAREKPQFNVQPREDRHPSGHVVSGKRTISPKAAASALGRPVVWAGPSIAAVELTRIKLAEVTTLWRGERPSRTPTLVLRYGRGWPALRPGRWVVVTEGITPDQTPAFNIAGHDELERGQLRLVRLAGRATGRGDRWFGAMVFGGAYVALESPRRDLLVTAARAMKPLR